MYKTHVLSRYQRCLGIFPLLPMELAFSMCLCSSDHLDFDPNLLLYFFPDLHPSFYFSVLGGTLPAPPSLTDDMPSLSFLAVEGCHWFNVGLSPDVFALRLASSPCQHSHLTGVEFLGIFFLSRSTFIPTCQCWLYYGFVVFILILIDIYLSPMTPDILPMALYWTFFFPDIYIQPVLYAALREVSRRRC